MYLKKSFIIINLILGIQHLAYADWINQAAMKVEPHTIQLRHYIHANPELGNLKFKTSELVQKELNAYGAEVKKGFANRCYRCTERRKTRTGHCTTCRHGRFTYAKKGSGFFCQSGHRVI